MAFMEKEDVFDKQHAKLFDIAANVHLEDGLKQVNCLKQVRLPTGEARKYLTSGLSLMCFSWITQSVSTRTRLVYCYGTHNNTQGVWSCKLPLDSLPLQQLALSPALMSCLSKQTTSLIVSDFCCKRKKIDTWYLTWIRMLCFWVKSYLTHVLSRWVGYCEMWVVATPVCQVVMTEGWLWHAVSLWWHNWNMIMIPNHRTCMNPLWHCELGYRVRWWHGSRRNADQKINMCMLWDFSIKICQGLQ